MPKDFLEWSIHQAKELGDPWFGKAETLAARLLLLNFAAIHSSSWAITHAILDTISSKSQYIEELRAEITQVLAAHGGEWNKRVLADMLKLDSLSMSIPKNPFSLLSSFPRNFLFPISTDWEAQVLYSSTWLLLLVFIVHKCDLFS